MTHIGRSANFFKTFREMLTTCLLNMGGLIAGFLVASYLGVFNLSTWALALFPAVIGAKSVIDGLLTGRLSTALHLGIIYPRFSHNTKSFYKLLDAIIVLTLMTSITISAISVVFGYLFWGLTLADFSAILSVIVATMVIGLALIIVTVKVAFVSFKRGLDPDLIVSPIMSTIATIFITFCYVLTLTLFFSYSDIGVWVIAFFGIAHLAVVLYIFPKNLHEPEFIKTIRESLATLIIVAFIFNLSGTILKGISDYVRPYTEIYTMYPAIISIVSSVGSVVGSTATTKLALGMLKPKFSSIAKHTKTIFTAWFASITIFVLLPFFALLLNGNFSINALYNLTSVLLVANLIAIIIIVMFSFGISILTFQKGLDPGNFVIPIETSFAATIASVALLAALLLVGAIIA